jgi:hypothetical protein
MQKIKIITDSTIDIPSELIEKNDKLENPTFLAVLTGGKYAYTRPDGVKVIPIGCLK